MPPGRPKSTLALATTERERLEGWAQASSTSQALAERALIVLVCAEGESNASVAAALGVTPQTVGKWRDRFVKERLSGLADAPRSGAPRRIPAGDVEWVLTLTLFARPRSALRWTTRSMADVCGISQASVSRIWQGFGLRPASIQTPHRRNDARTLAMAERLAALYLQPGRRSGVRVHRLEDEHGLRDWLAERDAECDEDDRMELILCECRSAAETLARDWQASRPRFSLHIAPRGPLWAEVLALWFQSAGTAAPAGGTRILQHIRETLASGRGSEGGTGAYTWSAAGERMIRTAAGFL